MEFVKYISKKKALYRTKNGYKIKKISILPIELSKEESQLYRRYQYSAKERCIDFNLSTTTFKRLIHSNCYYCGIEPKQKQGTMEYNGIDRLNNDDGYHLENCLACCKVCNRGKGTMSSGEYAIHLNRIVRLVMPQMIAFDSGDYNLTDELRLKQLKNAGVFILNT